MSGLTVVVPAYNEEDQVESTVRGLFDSLTATGHAFELVIVNDGSLDRTPEIIDRLARELPRVRALHQEDEGIGGAFRTGMRVAEHEYVMLWPADMPCERTDVEPFVSRLGQADVIVGVRRRRAGYNPLMRFNAWLYPRLVATFFGLDLRDVNWICAYRRAKLLDVPLTRRGIAMLAEILIGIRDRGGSFLEVEVDMKPRRGGVPSASRFPVMVRTLKDLLQMAWTRHLRGKGRALAVSAVATLFAWAWAETNLASIRKHNPENVEANGASLHRNATVWSVDNEYFLSPVENYLAGRGFRRSPPVGRGSAYRRMPGYSLLYLGAVEVFGVDGAPRAIKLAQLGLFGAACFALHQLILWLSGSRRLAVAFTLLAGVLPLFSGYVYYTLTEGITPPLMTLGLYFLVAARREPHLAGKRVRYLLASLALGYAVFTRPYLALSIVLLPAFIWRDLWHEQRMSLRQLAGGLALAATPVALLLGGWVVRNYRVGGEFVLLEQTYHPESLDRMKPEFEGLFSLAKACGQDGGAFNQYQLPLYASAVQGSADSDVIERVLPRVPAELRAVVGEERVRQALRMYRAAAARQREYIENQRPMPPVWLPEQLRAREELLSLAREYRRQRPLDYWVIAPLTYLRRLVLHSNTHSMHLFQEANRGVVVLNVIRGLLVLVHVSLYVAIVVNLVTRRDPLERLAFGLVPLLYVVFFVAIHREVETRYLLPLVPTLLAGLSLPLGRFAIPFFSSESAAPDGGKRLSAGG